jgi:hypothetical protein
MPSKKKTREKKTRSRKRSSPGLFGETLLDKLKIAPPGASDDAILMETLRTVPVDQVKTALKKAGSKERNLLFAALPGSQITSILGSLPAGVLAPWEPPAPSPPPAPTGGPPASILTTTYQNVPYPPAERDPNWSLTFSGGSTIGLTSPPPWEWVSVYDQSAEKEGSLNNPMVGLTGWVVIPELPGVPNPKLSQGDVWFVHPFGFDFEFYIVPDPQYQSLLAASNTGVTPGTGRRIRTWSRPTMLRTKLVWTRRQACSASRPTRALCRRCSRI